MGLSWLVNNVAKLCQMNRCVVTRRAVKSLNVTLHEKMKVFSRVGCLIVTDLKLLLCFSDLT